MTEAQRSDKAGARQEARHGTAKKDSLQTVPPSNQVFNGQSCLKGGRRE